MGNWEIGEFVRKWGWQLKMGLFETWSGHHDLVNARGQLSRLCTLGAEGRDICHGFKTSYSEGGRS